MKESRELAKKNWKGSGDSSVDEIWFEIKDRLGDTDFLGYETNKAEGVVISLLKNNKEIEELKENEEGMIITNQTSFYGESGGQIGDIGEKVADNFSFIVQDTYKDGDKICHLGILEKGEISEMANVKVLLKIDSVKRDKIKLNHMSTLALLVEPAEFLSDLAARSIVVEIFECDKTTV